MRVIAGYTGMTSQVGSQCVHILCTYAASRDATPQELILGRPAKMSYFAPTLHKLEFELTPEAMYDCWHQEEEYKPNRQTASKSMYM